MNSVVDALLAVDETKKPVASVSYTHVLTVPYVMRTLGAFSFQHRRLAATMLKNACAGTGWMVMDFLCLVCEGF